MEKFVPIVKFVKLTQQSGHHIYFNISKIESIIQCCDYTLILCEHREYHVEERAQEIMKYLEEQ